MQDNMPTVNLPSSLVETYTQLLPAIKGCSTDALTASTERSVDDFHTCFTDLGFAPRMKEVGFQIENYLLGGVTNQDINGNDR